MTSAGAGGVTHVAGITIPSASPVVLALVAVHVAAGLVCVIAGALAMLSPKRAGRHPWLGTAYVWGMAAVFVSMSLLSAAGGPQDRPLFALGAAAFAAAAVGRGAARGRRRDWPRTHIAGMGLSYVLLLTAFYVDNGASLPLWRALPAAAYWLGPMLIGGPLILWAMRRHWVVRTEAGRDRR